MAVHKSAPPEINVLNKKRRSSQAFACVTSTYIDKNLYFNIPIRADLIVSNISVLFHDPSY